MPNPGQWFMGQTRLCTETPLCLVTRVQLRRKHPPHTSTSSRPVQKQSLHSRRGYWGFWAGGGGAHMCRLSLQTDICLSPKHQNNTTQGLDSSCVISCYSSDLGGGGGVIHVYNVYGASSYASGSGSRLLWRIYECIHNNSNKVELSPSLASAELSGTYLESNI